MSFYGRKGSLAFAFVVAVSGTVLCSTAFTEYGGLWFSVARAIAGETQFAESVWASSTLTFHAC